MIFILTSFYLLGLLAFLTIIKSDITINDKKLDPIVVAIFWPIFVLASLIFSGTKDN